MKWISVKDRLPELGDRVLCAYLSFTGIRFEYSIECYYKYDGEVGFFSDHMNTDTPVTYWMPIEPPEVDND